jgi:flagellar basal body-associated protein FliL
MEEPEMTESERTKYRLKNFFSIIGILLIFVAISIIILIIFDKDLPEQQPNKKINNWNDSYTKADEFISKLNLTERIGLLYGTENMKSIIAPLLNN